MNPRLPKTILAILLTGNFLLSSMFGASGADEKVTVWVKSLSANTLKVDATKEGQTVKLVGLLKSTKNLQTADIRCYNGVDSPSPKWVAIEPQGNNSYRVTCTMPVGKTDVRGLNEASLGVNNDETWPASLLFGETALLSSKPFNWFGVSAAI